MTMRISTKTEMDGKQLSISPEKLGRGFAIKLDGKNGNCPVKSFTVATEGVNWGHYCHYCNPPSMLLSMIYVVDSFQNLVGSPCRGTGNGPY